MRNFIAAAVITIATIAAGCSTPAESYCAKAAECGGLGDSTEEGCITRTNAYLDLIRANEKEACDKLADAYAELFDCTSGLSCEELKAEDFAVTDCKKEWEAAKAAQEGNMQECRAL